jgi:PEP-CTERM motif
MRGKVVGLLAAALMGVCGVARPSIVYTVNISDGIEMVSGTITTDGLIGTPNASDITGWNLTAAGPAAFAENSSIPGAILLCSFGCGLTATATTLAYDFSSQIAGTAFFDCAGNCSIQFDTGEVDVFKASTGHFISESGNTIIARAAAPEPGTFTLLGLGLAGLGFARKRSRGGSPLRSSLRSPAQHQRPQRVTYSSRRAAPSGSVFCCS